MTIAAERETTPAPVGVRRPPLVRLLGLALVLLVALGTALAVGYAAAGPQPPGDGSADAGFARDMSTHHAQAVEMAEIVRSRTTDKAIRTLATDVSLGQTEQMGQMHAWLTVWGLPYGTTRTPMAWMAGGGGHGDGGGDGEAALTLLPDGRMPGMATVAEVNALRTLPAGKLEIRFLQLMIRHHTGGVAMAEAGTRLASESVVRDLAAKIVAAQTAEIEQMKALLAERGGAP